jgi:hypothetical protein
MNVPWAVAVRIVRGAKTFRNPFGYIRRKAVARRVADASQFAGRVKQADGYWLFGPDELPGARGAAAQCATIFEELQQNGSLYELRGNKKMHLRAILRGDDFARYPEIGRFALSRPVLEIAAGYFGSAPVLSSICLFWSVPTETIISSQKYHVDGEDVRQLKLFLNVWDHEDAHGPLTFYPSSTTTAILRHARLSQRLEAGNIMFDDDFVRSGSQGLQPLRVVGEAGAGVFLDTSRCMHFGSRHLTKERLMLMVQYAPYNLARESAIDLGSTDWIQYNKSDELQHLALQR